jgi:putative ABC transport system permease protein
MGAMIFDVRYALRMLRRSPGHTLAALATLTLGIGANATMFSVVSATLLAPPPFPEVERLMTVWQGPVDEPGSYGIVSYPNYRDWLERNRSFEHLALFDSAGRGYNLTSGEGEPEQVSGVRVTASFFPALGIQPLLGRTFLKEEEEAGRSNVVVLSHRLWQRRYLGDRGLVGRSIAIDGQDFTVIGVMPPDLLFQFWSSERELWVPAGWTEGDLGRGSNSFIALGCLAPGVDASEARAEMDLIGRALAELHPETNEGSTVRVVPATEYGLGNVRPVLLALLGVVGFVLLIACVNVANLLLARAAARTRELAVRGALGAGRARIARQLLTESLVLALLGGGLGVALAEGSVAFLPGFLPRTLRFLPLRPIEEIPLDGTVLLFTLAISCGAGILFGLLPAWSSGRAKLIEPLKESARGSSAGGNRLRNVLVSCEVGLTLVVVAGAGLMVTSLARLLDVDPGLDPENVLVMEMSLPQENLYYGPPDLPRFCQDLEEQVGSLPGVVSVSGIAHLPLSGARAGRGFTIEGRAPAERGEQPGAGYSVACPKVLETLGIALLAGRELVASDTGGAPGVVLVNESLVRRYFPDEEAVGKRFKLGDQGSDEPWLTIVGVFRDPRYTGLDQEPYPWFLRPYAQAGWPFFSVLAKTSSDAHAHTATVKQALARIEPDQPVTGVRTMEDVMRASVSGRRFPMMLLVAFALLSLALAAVGIAGVVGYTVVQRRREIGIRMALGARGADLLRQSVLRSMLWAAVGLVAGLVASAGLLRFLGSLLYDVAPTDLRVLALASAVLLAVAFVASYVPARRTTRIDPVQVLRAD